MLDCIRERGRRSNTTCQAHRDTRRCGRLRHDTGKPLRHEARVVSNADATGWIFTLAYVVQNGRGGNTHVGVGEIVRENASPAIGAEFDRLSAQISASFLPVRSLTTRRTS